MRGLVYIFIGLFALAIAAGAYWGLTFTPIEALLLGLIGLGFAVLFLQTRIYQRDQLRLEKAIQDLSRLLSTDAQAGQNLSQRLNALADIEADQRLETLEGDISVLGTVVRQLAESMAEIEEANARERNEPVSANEEGNMSMLAPQNNRLVEPVIPAEMFRQALREDRVLHYIEPIITLPQRRTHGFDLVPRLMLEDGELAQAEDFIPISGGEDLVAEIEALALVDAITFTRRSLSAGDPVTIYVPLSVQSLSNERETGRVLSLLDANKAVASHISFVIEEAQWSDLSSSQRNALEGIAKKGVGLSLSHARSLRLNFSELSQLGIKSIRAETARFIDQPATYTDFHTADIAAYVNRFEIDLIMTNVETEQHVLTLLEDGIGLAQGPHLAEAGPIHADLVKSGRPMPKPKLA